jgi:hypothetical protein
MEKFLLKKNFASLEYEDCSHPLSYLKATPFQYNFYYICNVQMDYFLNASFKIFNIE